MAQRLPKYFDLYDNEGVIVVSRARAVFLSKLLDVNYTRLYDIANLKRKIKGYRLIYSEEKTKRQEKFFCQFCRKLTKIHPITLSDPQRGSIKVCSKDCKQGLIIKLARIDRGYER